MNSDLLETCLADLPKSSQGYAQISTARAYAHPESGYDTQYSLSPEWLAAGQGLLKLLQHHRVRRDSLVEIGCGTGNLTLGYCAEPHFTTCVVTDPSEAFLEITEKKLAALKAKGSLHSQVKLAVLGAEDVGRLPDASASVIALRSTLHHVLELDRFFAVCARVLQPGGALVFEEPCREVFLLMAFCTNTFLESAHKELKDQKTREEFQTFRKAAEFYLRNDIDKSHAEDKHLFTTEQFLQLCHPVGLALRAYPNMAFEGFNAAQPWNTPQYTFEGFFRMYLKYCMSFSEKSLAAFDKHIAPSARYVDKALGPDQRPMMSSVFLCTKI